MLKERACFVWITSLVDPEVCPATTIPREHKEQQTQGRRSAIVTPPFLSTGSGSKRPERVEALGDVFLLALLLYSVVERDLRIVLARTRQDFAILGYRRTLRTTARMAMLLFDPRIVYRRPGGHRSSPPSAGHRIVLCSRGPPPVPSNRLTLIPHRHAQGCEKGAVGADSSVYGTPKTAKVSS